jgi:hypothetical protein
MNLKPLPALVSLSLPLFAVSALLLQLAPSGLAKGMGPPRGEDEANAGLGFAVEGKGRDVMTHMNEVLNRRGLVQGFDNRTARFVTVGYAVVTAPPGSADYHQSRRLAWQAAMQDARMQFVYFYSARVSTEIESVYEEPNAATLIDTQARGSADGLGQAVIRLVHKEVLARGVDLDSPSGRAVAKGIAEKVLASSEIRSAVRVAANGEIAGLQALETFEATNPGEQTEIGVIAVSSQKSRAMVNAIRGEGKAATGASKGSIEEWVMSLPVEQLIYTQGVLLRSGPGGEVWCLAFSQSSASSSGSQRSVLMARNKAYANGMQDLRDFAGVQVLCEQVSQASESVVELAGMGEIYESESSYREAVLSSGAKMEIAPVTPIRNWQGRHRLAKETPLVGSVYAWRASLKGTANVLLGDPASESATVGGEVCLGCTLHCQHEGGEVEAARSERSAVTEGLDEAILVALERGLTTRAGRDESYGAFVLTLVPLDGEATREQVALMQATAKTQLAEFFGAQVLSETESRFSEDNGVVASYFSSMSKVSVDKLLRGVGMHGLSKGLGGLLYGVFIASEKENDVSVAVSLSMRGGAPKEGESVEVMATGIAAIVGGAIDDARSNALQSARREAVEKVMGMTVVGFIQVKDMDVMRSGTFSDTRGFIEKWEEISGGQEGDYYIVRISARVTPKKLYDSYASHLASIGTPRFYVDAGDLPDEVSDLLAKIGRSQSSLEGELRAAAGGGGGPKVDRLIGLSDEQQRDLIELEDAILRFIGSTGGGFKAPVTDYLLGLGLPITELRGDASYIVRLKPKFEAVFHPINARVGLRLTLGVSLDDAVTGDAYLALDSDGRASNFGLTDEINRNVVIQKALDSIKGELHEKVNAVIEGFLRNGQLARIEFWEHMKWLSGKEDSVHQAIAGLPGVVKVTREIDGAEDELVFNVWYRGPVDFLEPMVTDALSQYVPSCSEVYVPVYQGAKEIVYMPSM